MTAIGDLLAREARRVPQREAVVFKSVRLTYAELDAAVDRWAAALQRHGVRHGDRLALLAPNSDDFLLCFFAGLRLGAILVPVNTRLAAPEVAHILSDVGASVLVVDAELAPVAERALPLMDGPAPAVVALDALAAARPIPGWTAPAVSEDDNALIIYTSGTTGLPKGVLLDHRRAVWAALSEIATLGLKDGERYLHLVPFYHSGGIVYIITTALLGGTHVVLPAFTPTTLLDAVENERCTFFLGVPTMFQLLLQERDLERRDLSSWRIGVFGAAAMPRAAVERMVEAFPHVELVQLCGQTEGGPAGLYASAAQVRERPDATGRQAMVFFEHRVVDADGRDVAPGGIGELLYRGPSVMKGYWNQPEATAETLRDGWLHTGDVVRLDADGYMTVVDRLKDVILTGGRNVYSQEVERVLDRHEAIADCAVVARTHPIYGESIVAVVTAADPSAPPALESVRAHCREQLADYKVPHDLLVVDALPRNAGGKVLKRELRALVAKPVAQAR